MSTREQYRGFLRDTFAQLCRNRRMWLLHLFVDAVLIFLGCAWFWTPDKTSFQFITNGVSAVGFIIIVLWFQGGTLVFYRHQQAPDTATETAFRLSRRHLPALIVWLVLAVLAYWFLGWLADQVGAVAAWVASLLTFKTQHPITPNTIATIYDYIMLFFAYWLWPTVLLNAASRTAENGFSGIAHFFRGWFWSFRSWQTLVAYAVILFVGWWVPYRLTEWTPGPVTLTSESISAIIRFLVSYVLMMSMWLLLCSALGRARRHEQPAAAASPQPAPAPARA